MSDAPDDLDWLNAPLAAIPLECEGMREGGQTGSGDWDVVRVYNGSAGPNGVSGAQSFQRSPRSGIPVSGRGSRFREKRNGLASPLFGLFRPGEGEASVATVNADNVTSRSISFMRSRGYSPIVSGWLFSDAP